ncbi:Serine/threonine-protein phosphatase 6 regulatory ankyrin repeat subunit C [Trichoderma lentiforme]|uniref:Serine/threonine-protein phosphatase 6 regulatory ankyrin repeat subunit C n=1 Tax=Trichoderma lentiforme TaxID=1567552 RepID=A0A9P4X386_9HYPO|nr:Serine/threonine-protein phosphatase 6 regulatory ankyrin repeat subunit C [Trichoderma lentiforme]
MNLGFDADFLAIFGHVNQIRRSFAGAPGQFRAISDDIRGFHIVLQDIEANYIEISPKQSQEYQSIVSSCEHLLVQLEKTLEKYADVAQAGKPDKKTTIRRIWKRLKWEPEDIRDIRSQISVKIATLRSLSDQIIGYNIANLVRHQENTEREATLKWISDINYVAQQNDVFLRCQMGSRKWLFESELYLEWCKRKGSLLFCPGNPGTGKTFTTAMVVESLRLANDAETLTTYMYCSYQNHTQTIEKLLCSLLRVALEEAHYEADGTVSICEQLRLSNKAISRQHCLGLLQELFSRFARVNLIVDALDELTNEVRRPLIYDLLKLHENGIVSLLVTSRGIPEIQHLFESRETYTSLEVRSSDEDIQNFLRDNIFQLPNFVARSQKLQDEVIDSVTNASAGMFLLAELYLKSLANIISAGSLRTRLSNLATGSNAYDALYEDSMLRIGFQGPELEHIAVQMLLVLTCARRPLSPQELSHALSIDESSQVFDEYMVPDMDDMVAACTGLVVLDDTSNIVHLVHKSAAEYFERTRSRWFPRANEKMALMCLRYLQIAETKPKETRGEDAPFFQYAKANWSYHSMEGEKEAAKDAVMSDDLQTNSVTDYTMSPNTLAITQLAIHQMTKEVVDVDSSIVEACHASHQAWVEQLLVVRNYDANIHGISQKTFISEDGSLMASALPTELFKDNVLLTIAAARGDHGMASMLLAQGSDPNIFNAMGQTPLSIAAMNGFDNLVSLLLDQKSIEPDLMCQHSGLLSTAFLTSIEFRREGCFKLLLEKSNRRARDSFKRGAMWLAAAAGYNSIISELLKWPDVECDYTDTDFCGNPLTAAVKGGHEAAALLLLPYSKCRSCIHCGVTPMHHVVRNGRHKLLQQLLEQDASAVDSELYITRPHDGRHDLDDSDKYDMERARTPLTTAISLRDVQATQLLLPYANPNHGLNTWRPLHEAAEWGNAEIFELLLKREGIELDPVDEHGQTPFLLAAKRGHCDMMNALTKLGGIQLDRRATLGYVADHYILNHFPDIRVGCFHILMSVLDKEVNKKYSAGFSFLHRACSLRPKISIKSKSGIHIFEVELLETNSGHLVAELLKRPDIDVNLLDKEGYTPLLLAVKNHQRDVVRLLLEREDTKVGNNALSLASFYQPMLKQLFERQLVRKNILSIKGEIRPLRGPVPTRYRVDHWPEVLNAEFKEYAESIFSMLFNDKRIDPTTFFSGKRTDLTTLVHDKHTDLYHCEGYWAGAIARVIIGGTKSMIQAVSEVTELAPELKILFSDDKSLISRALEWNDDDEAVELLIALCSSAVLQKADSYGRTPLSIAAQRDTSKATQLLLNAGVNINVVHSTGQSPLSKAAEKGHPNTARLLLAADETPLNIPDWQNCTPLMHAASRMNIPVVSVLLERPNVDVLVRDRAGHSFLCRLMVPNSPDRDGYGSEKVMDDVIYRIHHLLQSNVDALKDYTHSPFLCAVESQICSILV